jgi:LysM repeat protein
MRRLAVLALLLGLIGALFVPIGAPAPTHTVVRGDTLSKLGKQHGVTVAELRAWNDLTGDRIDVGQPLALGPSPTEPLGRRLWARLRPEPAAATTPRPHPAAPPPRKTRRAPRTAAPTADAGPTPWPALRRPKGKPCLSDDTVAGEGMARSVGLEPDQITAGVRAFQGQTLRCAVGKDVVGTVWLDLVVGCDGRVTTSAVSQHDTGDDAFAACVADAFGYASFDAHARDAVEFSVPIVFTPPPGG